jgi:hypothetical protein
MRHHMHHQIKSHLTTRARTKDERGAQHKTMLEARHATVRRSELITGITPIPSGAAIGPVMKSFCTFTVIRAYFFPSALTSLETTIVRTQRSQSAHNATGAYLVLPNGYSGSAGKGSRFVSSLGFAALLILASPGKTNKKPSTKTATQSYWVLVQGGPFAGFGAVPVVKIELVCVFAERERVSRYRDHGAVWPKLSARCIECDADRHAFVSPPLVRHLAVPSNTRDYHPSVHAPETQAHPSQADCHHHHPQCRHQCSEGTNDGRNLGQRATDQRRSGTSRSHLCPAAASWSVPDWARCVVLRRVVRTRRLSVPSVVP